MSSPLPHSWLLEVDVLQCLHMKTSLMTNERTEKTTAAGYFTNMKTCLVDLFCTHISYNYKQHAQQVRNKTKEVLHESIYWTNGCKKSIFGMLK